MVLRRPRQASSKTNTQDWSTRHRYTQAGREIRHDSIAGAMLPIIESYRALRHGACRFGHIALPLALRSTCLLASQGNPSFPNPMYQSLFTDAHWMDECHGASTVVAVSYFNSRLDSREDFYARRICHDLFIVFFTITALHAPHLSASTCSLATMRPAWGASTSFFSQWIPSPPLSEGGKAEVGRLVWQRTLTLGNGSRPAGCTRLAGLVSATLPSTLCRPPAPSFQRATDISKRWAGHSSRPSRQSRASSQNALTL